jgi:hypothetical protein
MKRLVFAVAVLGLMACAKKEQAAPAADTTMTPAAAPAAAPTDTAKAAAPADTTKMGGMKKQ